MSGQLGRQGAGAVCTVYCTMELDSGLTSCTWSASVLPSREAVRCIGLGLFTVASSSLRVRKWGVHLSQDRWGNLVKELSVQGWPVWVFGMFAEWVGFCSEETGTLIN